MTRYGLDPTVRRFGTTVLGGSPLRLFRLTRRGADLVERIVTGDDLPPSTLTDSLLEAGAIHPVAEPGGSSRHGPSDVTIVVPTLGPPDHVPPGAVVVDDASDPPVPGATLRLDRNRGPAGARNAGLARVTTALVAFVDADVEVGGDWLERLLPHFDDPRVALVAPRVRSRPAPGSLGRYEREHGPLDLGPSPARVRAGTRVSYVPGAAIVCRVDALRRVGGFDESLRFGEDVDLVWRLDAAGYRCRYEPDAEVVHDLRSSFGAWLRQRVDYGSSAAPLARRHPGALAPFRASGWSVGVWALVVLGRPVLAGAVSTGTAAALVRKLPDVPAPEAFRLATDGNLQVGRQLAGAIRRAWWPLLAVAAVRSRPARRVLVTAVLLAGHPLRAADDAAYSVGVWKGIVAERTLAPLVPDLTSWPGRPSGPRRRTTTSSAPPSEPLPSTA